MLDAAVDPAVAAQAVQAHQPVAGRHGDAVGEVVVVVDHTTAGQATHHRHPRGSGVMALDIANGHRRAIPGVETQQRPPARRRGQQEGLVEGHVEGRLATAVRPEVPDLAGWWCVVIHIGTSLQSYAMLSESPQAGIQPEPAPARADTPGADAAEVIPADDASHKARHDPKTAPPRGMPSCRGMALVLHTTISVRDPCP